MESSITSSGRCPSEGQLGQGLIAGVPAKVMITPDEVLLVVSAGLAHELSERVW